MPKIKSTNIPSCAENPVVIIVKGHQDKDDHTYVFWYVEEAIAKAEAFAEKTGHDDWSYFGLTAAPASYHDVGAVLAYDASTFSILDVPAALGQLEKNGVLPGVREGAGGYVKGSTEYVIDVLGVQFEDEDEE